MRCEYELLNGLSQEILTGPLLAWEQKLTVQNFTLEIENLLTPVCR